LTNVDCFALQDQDSRYCGCGSTERCCSAPPTGDPQRPLSPLHSADLRSCDRATQPFHALFPTPRHPFALFRTNYYKSALTPRRTANLLNTKNAGNPAARTDVPPPDHNLLRDNDGLGRPSDEVLCRTWLDKHAAVSGCKNPQPAVRRTG
jgi:hypothetical protein